MMRVLRGLLGAFLATSILACSGLGLCWTQLVPRGHDCCESEGAAPARSCGSEAAPAAVAHLPVAAAIVLPLPQPRAPEDGLPVAPLAPPARVPALVLRI